jgi:hypothetical protein
VNTKIETLDRKRMRYLEWYLIGFGVFLALSITRFFFRGGGLNSQPIGTAVFIGLLVSLADVAVSTLGLALLGREIKADPSLRDALYNELVQSLETLSWKAAYISAIGTTSFFAAVSFFYPVCDPVLVALTSIIAGAGAYQAMFYFKYRSL